VTHISFPVGGYEGAIVWRFLDGVSSAVSARMLRGSPPGEENLTFLLCELLDANTTSLHALAYPLAEAQKDLQASDSGIAIDIEFETHEHSKHIESKYSGADIGIVVTINHPLLGNSRRGILIQAKRLFGRGKSREFSFFSEYSSFDRGQADFLKTLQNRFSAWNSVYYLWYNPPSVGFAEPEAKTIRAYEAHSTNGLPHWGRIHPFLDELIGMGFPWFGSPRPASTADEEKAREWRATQPALRISALDPVFSLFEHRPPRLKELYDSSLEDRSSSPSFAPFADFFLLALASSRYGSANDDWVRLTEGQKVPMPLPKEPDEKALGAQGNFDHAPIPRHTIKLTVSSTLPNIG